MLTFRDITVVNQFAQIKAEKEAIQTIATTISHEMLNPLKSVLQVVDKLLDLHDETSLFYHHISLINNTTKFMLAQVKGNLDTNLLRTG